MKRHNTCNGDVRTDIPVFRTAYKQKRAGDRPENKNGNEPVWDYNDVTT